MHTQFALLSIVIHPSFIVAIGFSHHGRYVYWILIRMANLVCFIIYVSRDYRINAASICYGHNLAKDSFALSIDVIYSSTSGMQLFIY